MALFKAVLIEHGYATTRYEEGVISAAGGEFIDAEKMPLDEALALCETTDAILFRRLTVTADMLRRFRRCKIIVRYGVGTDNVDVAAATELGIMVGHVPGYCIDEVSTHALALWLDCVRAVSSTREEMAHGKWDVHREEPLFRVAGKTMGVVGLGNIGQALARKLQGWNLRVLAFDPFADPALAKALGVTLVEFPELCRQADFISLHCPLLPETFHLLDEKAFALMKRGVMVINTARGPVVDTAALVSALERGVVSRAGLDVFEEEPLPGDSVLRSHPRVVVTDHTAWYSEESQAQLQSMAAEEIARVGRGGLPLSLANPEVIYRLDRAAEWKPAESMRWQLQRCGRAI
jgi:D-3-phosphoglycerate dehydrogenase